MVLGAGRVRSIGGCRSMRSSLRTRWHSTHSISASRSKTRQRVTTTISGTSVIAERTSSRSSSRTLVLCRLPRSLSNWSRRSASYAPSAGSSCSLVRTCTRACRTHPGKRGSVLISAPCTSVTSPDAQALRTSIRPGTGTVLREFKRVRDASELPPEIVALYEDGTEIQGALVYR